MGRFFLFVPVLWFFLAGCHRAETEVANGNREQVLLLGNGAEPTDLDPHVITGTKEFAIATALFEGLASVDPVDSHPTPGVAERWEISPDGKVYTFHLRPDARYSNGDPVTADDFVYSWRRELTPAPGAEFCFYLFDLHGAADFNAGRTTDLSTVGARALDPATFEVTLDHPTPYFLNLLRAPPFFPVHRALIEAAGPFDGRGTGWTRGPTGQQWPVYLGLNTKSSRAADDLLPRSDWLPGTFHRRQHYQPDRLGQSRLRPCPDRGRAPETTPASGRSPHARGSDHPDLPPRPRLPAFPGRAGLFIQPHRRPSVQMPLAERKTATASVSARCSDQKTRVRSSVDGSMVCSP